MKFIVEDFGGKVIFVLFEGCTKKVNKLKE
jgi:hypothetical protein